LGAALLLCACSPLKTASLRDARILKHGESEISGELSTSGAIERATLLLAAPDDASVRTLRDSIDDPTSAGRTDMPLFGAYFSHGLAHGFEWNAGFSTSMIPSGALLADMGLKKRLYANRHLFLSAAARLAAGMTSNIMEYGHADTAGNVKSATLKSRTVEAGASALALVKVFPMLSLYYDFGLTRGALSYSFKNAKDSTLGPVDGFVGLFGITHHVGLVLEFKEVEIALEQGFLFYDHGYVPSLGLRWSFKEDWKE
jgi:hypothetical protein